MVLLATAILTNQPVFASDDQDRYMILSLGANSCERFLLDNKSANQRLYYANWLAGYLTSFNKFNQGTVSILGNSNIGAAYEWMLQYCLQNPLDTFSKAAEALVVKLYPDRRK